MISYDELVPLEAQAEKKASVKAQAPPQVPLSHRIFRLRGVDIFDAMSDRELTELAELFASFNL